MDAPLPKTRRLEMAGTAGRIEARLDRSASDETPRFLAVVGHPHPQHGGTMFNNVVVHTSRCLVGAGAAVLRFDFRGVGRSAGHYDEGVGEREDFRIALRTMKERFGGAQTVMAAGFSFGSIRAMECAEDGDADLFLGIAPPLRLEDDRRIPVVPQPSALVLAGADELVPEPPRAVLRRHFPDLRELQVVPAAGHLFTGQLEALRHAVNTAIAALLPSDSPRDAPSSAPHGCLPH